MENLSIDLSHRHNDSYETILEEHCNHCYGEGKTEEFVQETITTKSGKQRKRGKYVRTPCLVCHGTGIKLTSLGEALLEFVKKHLKVEEKNDNLPE